MEISSSASAEDIENNLRLFALRKAAASSKEFSHIKNHIIVKVDSTANQNCPRHGQENDRHHSCQDMSSYGDYNGRDREYNELQQHVSRKEMARELRLLAARQEREAKSRVVNLSSPVMENGRRGSSFSPGPTPTGYHQYTDYQRSESVDPWPQYNSMPRRMSANPTSYGSKTKPVHRHGSFQEGNVTYGRQPSTAKVDVFKGRVDFKSILRRFDPKDEERAFGGQRGSYNAQQKSKYVGAGSQKEFTSMSNSAYQDPHSMQSRSQPPKRGAIVDSDFDFRGSAPALTSTLRSMSPQQMMRPLSPSISTSSNSNMFPVHHNRPVRPQKLDLDISSRKRQQPISIQTNNRPTSPNNYPYPTNTKSESNPVSPRRVEFSEQVFSFSFAGNEPTNASLPFPPPPLMVSSPVGKKPILRQSNSDPHSSVHIPAFQNQTYNGAATDKSKIDQHEQKSRPSLIQQFERQEIERRIQQQLRDDHERLMASMNMVSPLTIEHTNLDEELTSGIGESGSDGSTGLNQRRKVSSESLVQIYVPPTKSNEEIMKNQCSSQKNIHFSLNLESLEGDNHKTNKDSTDTDSDSNDISETSGATSTSVNTTFDADGGGDESDEGTLSARTESFEELEKELDRSQGEEIVTGSKKESVPCQAVRSNEEKENLINSSANSYTKKECPKDTDHVVKQPTGLKAMRTLSAEVSHKKIAPHLADWNRSQSFPVPTKSSMKEVIGITGNYLRDENGFSQDKSHDETGIFLEGLPRKSSNHLIASRASVNNEGKLRSKNLGKLGIML